MKREDMSWEEIRNLPPNLRFIAEEAKKKYVLEQSWYKDNSDLTVGCQNFLSILTIIGLILVVWFVIAF